MALVPRIVAASLPSTVGGRQALHGPVAAVDPAPLAELDQKSMITNDGAAFRYEDFSTKGRFRREGDTPDRPRDRDQQNFSGLIVGSTMSFVDAFSVDAATAPRGRATGPTKSVVAAGVANYESTAKVITDDLPVLGEKLSLSL
jgi:phage baseplate assembly protein gpV